MKKMILVSMLLIAGLCCNAQEAGKVCMMRVCESHTPSTKSFLRIINSDGKVDYVEVSSGVGNEETDKKR